MEKNYKQSLMKTGAVIALTATILSNLTGCAYRLQSFTPSFDQPSTSITETYSKTPGYSLQKEYENMIMSVTGADYNEFVSLVDNTNVIYTYAQYYQVDKALEEQQKYAEEIALQPQKYNELICDITEIPSVELIKSVIFKNSEITLKVYKGLTEMPSTEIDIIANILHHMIEINYDSFNENDLRRIYSLLNDISVAGIDSTNFEINELMKPYNARVLDNGIIMIDLQTINDSLKEPNAKERTYEHEIYHLFQRMCPDARIKEYYQIGPSQFFDGLEVNSLHWNWLYEASAERLSMEHFDAEKPLVYENMVGYLKSLDLITLIRPEYENTAIEQGTLKVNPDYLFDMLGAHTEEEKIEVINLLYSIDYILNNRGDLERAYAKENGSFELTDRTTIKRDMENSICLSLTKIFYRNLAERVRNTDVSIQDIFYLINAFEEDINSHIQYDEKTANYIRLMSEYVKIQDGFFMMLAGNDQALFDEIVSLFNTYSMTIETDEGLRKNCELNWLTEKEKQFIYDQMVNYNIKYLTTNIRNTK